ncbi:MAG: hypothetical protein KAS66_16265 [Candidatus Omnitrophica bacterium]|nr:hypothetical protein [Candidatus Omnitrophota bacterium]
MKLTIKHVGCLLLGISLMLFGSMIYLGYHDLMTASYLAICIVLISLLALVGAALADNERIKKEETSTLFVIVCIILCVVIGISMVWVGVLLDDKPDKISYGGSGHIVGSFDNGIVFYQDENGWTMIIPEDYGEPDMNCTAYYTYHWNGTTWIFVEEE